MEYLFAERMRMMQPSTIREILKVVAQPDIISFAGGLPAPELFPIEDISLACTRVLQELGPQALQYATTEGCDQLRLFLIEEMERRGIRCTLDNIIVTCGSQQALDLIARALFDAGDCVFVESPTYLAALQVFQSYQVRFVQVPTDDDGIIVDALPDLIEKHHPKLLYCIPNFQNPSGRTLSGDRRKRLYETAVRYGLPVVEDDPYGKLRYSGTHIPPVKSLDRNGNIVYISTFSKTVAPGLRIGWAVADESLVRKMIIAKQAADLHTSSLTQLTVARYHRDFDYQKHIETIRQTYKSRFTLMHECLSDTMPEGYSWTRPEGGMFLWVTCPGHIDTNGLLATALQNKICFVPGRDFFPDGSGKNFMRLNFSNATPDRIRQGIARLADICKTR